jgi:hypothetical protein
MHSKTSLSGPAPVGLMMLTGKWLLLEARPEGVVASPKELLVMLPAAPRLLLLMVRAL